MFMNDVYKKEEIRSIAIKDLRKFGIKCRPKKPKTIPTDRYGAKVFNVPLSALPTQTVTLSTGQQIIVPRLVHQLCSLITLKINTEGLFRKEGSKSRQNEIRIILDAGCILTDDHHVIDIAVILKKFLRQLPEPLIPYNYHELFLRCVLLDKNKLDAILLACLLLPQEHLNTLSYLMQFFYEVAEHSNINKMTAYNIAVVIGPTVFPMDDKISPNPQLRLTKTCELFKLLIENARSIGEIPDNVIEQIGNINNNNNDEVKKTKKRRSGSLTRMFNGLKKIVSGKSDNDTNDIPDLLTPVNNQTKKRRLGHGGISNKKKKELLNKLPDNTPLSAPFTPIRTPVNMNLSGSVENKLDTSNHILRERKSLWFSKSRSVKNLKQESENNAKTIGKSLERRWSTVNEICNIRRLKKRNSCGASLQHLKQSTDKIATITETNESDYVRVPKTEYEQFVNKVQEIEHRLSTFELENVRSGQQKQQQQQQAKKELDSVKNVQTIYEQTLEQSEQLSPTTDKLAKRLSRDLKIRHSLEQKIIRSPSARKIGTIRRRSLEKNNNNSSNTKLMRHQSWHTPPPKEKLPKVTSEKSNIIVTAFPKVQPTKTEISCNLSGSSTDYWVSAEGFFTTTTTPSKSNKSTSSIHDRASLTRLRNQNAGMVMMKARLFDQMKSENSSTTTSTSENSSNNIVTRSRPNHTNKIGAQRTIDSRLSYRVRTLKYEDRRLPKKSISPRRRQHLTQNKKLQIARQLDVNLKNCDKENVVNLDKTRIISKKDCNRVNIGGQQDCTPKSSTPYIKKTLHVKSPKRLYRTPGLDKGTPLKALATPTRHNLV